jgi:hypothetical protein
MSFRTNSNNFCAVSQTGHQKSSRRLWMPFEQYIDGETQSFWPAEAALTGLKSER